MDKAEKIISDLFDKFEDKISRVYEGDYDDWGFDIEPSVKEPVATEFISHLSEQAEKYDFTFTLTTSYSFGEEYIHIELVFLD